MSYFSKPFGSQHVKKFFCMFKFFLIITAQIACFFDCVIFSFSFDKYCPKLS